LAQLSEEERRILLTRDQGLLKRGAVTHGYWVRTTAPREQLREVLERFDLQHSVKPFTRCLSCNGLLHTAPLAEVQGEVPENAVRYHHDFWRCESCRKIYWQGSHYQRMKRLIEDVLAATE
jgi:uncharacterized protein with PIN domain